MYKRKLRRWRRLAIREKDKIVYDFVLIEKALKNIVPEIAESLSNISVFGRTALNERIYQEISTKHNLSVHQIESVINEELNSKVEVY